MGNTCDIRGREVMKQGVRRVILAAGIAACFRPAASRAFDAVDEILWPDRGTFPAYPAEPPDGRTVRFSAYTGLMHDDNVLRVPDNAVTPNGRSDNIFRLGASLDANIPV